MAAVSQSSAFPTNGNALSHKARHVKSFGPCLMSMNGRGTGRGGGGGNGVLVSGADVDREAAVSICETRTLPTVPSAELALPQLNLALSAMNADPPRSNSGIIRLQVPIRQRADAIEWLHAQRHEDLRVPRCYFSARGGRRNHSSSEEEEEEKDDSSLLFTSSPVDDGSPWEELISVAGVGSAVLFRGSNPFNLDDWRSIKRFLSKDSPLIRAYGAMRFDARTIVSPEWKDFGAFYFLVPQVEFNELRDGSMLALTIAWDDRLLRSWHEAVNELKVTLQQISPSFGRVRRPEPRTAIVNFHHFPSKGSWDMSVKKALDIINGRNSELVKVVLARCSRYVTDSVMDPLALLVCLKAESQNAYQFYIQPPDAPAFIGNTPEQLFHRKYFNITSEALAGTRARGITRIEDFQIGQDLLCSPKDNIEFEVVRESIRRKLEVICNDVIIEPSKVLRKLPRVQHLCAQLSGILRDEDDEFDILTSLHPSPAVCGLPTEEARQFIEENEMFDRGMYAGPVGWFGGTESEFAVGIRSALVGKDLSTLVYAGAGIVDGTNPSSEWQELDLKASQFTKLLHHQERQFFLSRSK